jgi:hypothetical protein
MAVEKDYRAAAFLFDIYFIDSLSSLSIFYMALEVIYI